MSAALPPEIRMIHNIAVQFGHLPPERAAEEIANHVRRFWDPRMRTRLIELASERDDLDPVVRAAVDLVRGEASVAPGAASPDRLVSVKTADGWLEVDLAEPQTLLGVSQALGIRELAEGHEPAREGLPMEQVQATIERVTGHWATTEVLLALEQEDVRPTRSSVDPGLVSP
ncbi:MULTISPECIES: formate dehydrogenase subunit delta [unclassified Nocardioides]|uniref:formate dehydrogenase subunit delta n=1 Tax=unclassified Nocardioides TaxID=2615069 RepID=UPI00361E2BFB